MCRNAVVPGKAKVRFMDERRRGQRLVVALAKELPVRDLAKLVVDEREEPIETRAFSAVGVNDTCTPAVRLRIHSRATPASRARIYSALALREEIPGDDRRYVRLPESVRDSFDGESPLVAVKVGTRRLARAPPPVGTGEPFDVEWTPDRPMDAVLTVRLEGAVLRQALHLTPE